jgi:hypothetical protein
MLKRAAMIALVALGLVPVQASASDVSATHTYIQANYALNRAQVSLIHPGEAKIQAYNHRIATECPRAGAGAPQTDAAYPMSYEVAVALWSLAYGTAAAPIRKFVNAVKPLRWSNARLTRIAHGYATSLHELSTLPLPDLCGDVRAWAASRFQAIPASTTALDRRLEAIEGETIPRKLLAPFERGGDAGVVVRTRSLEVKLAEEEFVVGQTDWDQVQETLALR